MMGAPFLFAFSLLERGLFEVPEGESRSPSGGDMAALRKALVMNAVCGAWSRGGRAAGGQGHLRSV